MQSDLLDIKKARELLGKESEKMTDAEVRETERQMRTLANIIIDTVMKMTPEERGALDKKIKEEKRMKKTQEADK